MKRRVTGLVVLTLLAIAAFLIAWSGGKDRPPQPAAPVVSTPAPSAPQEALPATNPEKQPGVPPSSIAGKESRLDVVIEGRIIHLRNGGKVFLGDGLTVEVFVDPYPPTTLRAWLDLYLTRDSASQAVSTAEAAIEYDMRYMFHGLLRGEAKNLGDGHYLFTLDYLMYGAWDQLVTIHLGEKRYDLPLVIVAYP